MTRAARRVSAGDRASAVFRICIGGNAMLAWYAAIAESRSLMHLVAVTGQGVVLNWLLMLAGAAAILDAVINDVLPARFHWRVALRQRHFILFAMAFCYAAQLYVAFFSIRSTGLLLYYLWTAGMIMLAAFIDAHQRAKDATCAITCN
ncbi:MAG: hypothetical protein V4724_26455 [Pseudomonadota bacterium]